MLNVQRLSHIVKTLKVIKMFVNRATIGYNETDSTTNRLDEGYNKTEIFQNEQNQSQNPNSQLNTSQILCLFCLSDKIDSIPLHGETDEAQNARNIIAKYFWFDVSLLTIEIIAIL